MVKRKVKDLFTEPKGFVYIGKCIKKAKSKLKGIKKVSIVKKCISCKHRRVSPYHHFKCVICWDGENKHHYK